MRIAVVSSDIGNEEGGAWTFTKGLTDQLAQQPHEHEFVVWPLRQRPHSTFLSRLTRRIAGVVTSTNVMGPDARKLQQRCIDDKIDLVWFLNAAEPLEAVPYIATVWDLQHRLQPWFPEVRWTGWKGAARERYYSQILRGATRIFVSTEQGRKEVERFYGVPSEIIRILPLFAPVELEADLAAAAVCPPELKELGSRPFFFYPAQFWPHKNHIGLLSAFIEFRKSADRDYALVLVGSDKGNIEHVRQYVSNNGLENSVFFLGFVPRSTLIYCYKNAVSLCFSSYFGPDNIPPLEAFSLGCPVLTSDVSGSAEQLGNAALHLPAGDSYAWANAMKSVAENVALRADLRRRGSARVADLTAAHYVSRAITVIDEFEQVRRNWTQDYQSR